MMTGVVEMHRRNELGRPRRDTDKSDTTDEKELKTTLFLSMGRRIRDVGALGSTLR